MRAKEFWKASREFDTKKAAERHADFRVAHSGKFELQTWSETKTNGSREMQLVPATIYLLRVYSGKGGRPIDFTYFGTHEQRTARMNFYAVLAKDEEARKEREKMARATTVNPYKVGDLFYNSFGYDMTINEFFQVTRVSAKAVWVRPIASKVVEGSAGYSGYEVAERDAFIDGAPEIKHIFVVRVLGDKVYSGLVGLSEYKDGSKIYFNRMD